MGACSEYRRRNRRSGCREPGGFAADRAWRHNAVELSRLVRRGRRSTQMGTSLKAEQDFLTTNHTNHTNRKVVWELARGAVAETAGRDVGSLVSSRRTAHAVTTWSDGADSSAEDAD